MRSSHLAALAVVLTCLAAPMCFSQCGSSNLNSPYGIEVHAPMGAALAMLFNEVQNCGIGWIRVDFVWSWVETSQDNFNWSIYDAIVAAANSRNLLVYASIGNTPAWATSGTPGIGVPNSAADFYDICYRAAQRYDGNHGKGTVLYWGMWNEANLDEFWEGTQQQYIDIILKNGADGIHAGNPNAKVCGPEMAHLTSGDKDWYDWLRKSIEQAGTKLDVCTHHLYDGDGPGDVTAKLENSTAFGGTPSMWDVVNPSVKEVLQYTGWYGKPFWLTETGWQSGDVGETNQANYYTGLLNAWCTGQPGRGWLHRIFFYELNDSPAFPYTWGIVVLDANNAISYRKPAYTAYKNFITAHPPTPPPPCKATNPSPANLATNVNINADLSWTVGEGTTSHKIYFGTTNPPSYKTQQSGTTYDPGTMSSSTTYYWRIDEVGPGGTATGDVWRFTTAAPDTTAPSVPTNVQATATSSSSIQITWTASTDNVGVTGYKIRRNGSQVGTSAALTYIDTGLQASTTYSYTVSAYDAAGNNSAQSSPPATATTLPAGATKLYANDDCYTWNAEPSTTHDDQGIQCKSQPTNLRYGWLEFTLGSVGVTNAAIWMYQTGYWVEGNYGTRFRGAEYNINEATLTYNNQPDASAWTNVGGWTGIASEEGKKYYSRDITSFYNNNLGKRITFRMEVTTAGTNYGGTYEDREGSKGTTNYPYVQITPDTTAPSPGVCSSPAYANSAFTVSYTGAGDAGGSGFKWTWLWYKKGAGGTWTSTGLSSTSAPDGSFTFAPPEGEGTYYFMLQAADNAGNASPQPSGSGDCSTLYDISAPSGSIVINGDASYATSASVTLTLSASDGGSGVSQMRFSNDGSSWSGWEAYSTSKSWSLSTGDGAKTVYVQYRDNAGNQSGSFTDGITLDGTPPNNPTSCVEGGGAGNGLWQNTVADPGFTWSGASDQTSGVQGYYWYFGAEPNADPSNWTVSSGCDPAALGEGTHYLRVKTKDNAGNTSAADAIFTFKYDGTPPADFTPSASPAGWTNSSVSVTFSTTDSMSGLSRYEIAIDGGGYTVQTSPYTMTQEGEHIVHVKAIDNAGNARGPKDVITYIDTAAPSTPTVADDGAYTASTGQIHATWSATDSLSSISEYHYAISATKTEGGIITGGGWQSVGSGTEGSRTGLSLIHGQAYYVLVKAKDNAGNWSAIGASDGIVPVQNSAVSVGAAKALADDATVGLAGKTVTAVYADCFYIEELDRHTGIKVVPVEMPAGIAIGKTVDVGGTIQLIDGERAVVGAVVSVM